MLTIHTEAHRQRNVQTELYGGQLIPPFEKPERVDTILAALAAARLGPVEAPDLHDDRLIRRVHAQDYLDFLQSAWERWRATGYLGEAIATSWPARRMTQRPPRHIDGLLGWYGLSGETSIGPGTWEAARAAADVALTAASRVAAGLPHAFALCRPPGHHATRDMFGGYCFLNNAALAVELLRDQGAARVAILDVDFHHGNGTQDLYWTRGDVLFASLHGQPEDAFPYFMGYADERGAGEGEGSTLNYPLPPGTLYQAWAEALDHALTRIRDFGAEALVVSLGTDTFERDPISFFKLTTPDFHDYGMRIGRLRLPTVWVMEGGYAVAEIGLNVAAALQGHLETAR